MSKPNPDNMIFSLRFAYYLNYATPPPVSVSVPATSIAAGHTISNSVTIPINSSQDSSNIKFNISTDSSKWYSFPSLDLTLDANFSISVVGAYSGSSLTLTFYTVNQTASTHTSTAYIAIVSASTFISS